MPTTTIPWGDGSGDNLYLTYPSASGDQSVSVTSDANTGAARSKVVTFSASGVPSVTLTISQDAGGITPVFYDYLVFDGTAYIETDIVPGADDSFRCGFGSETQRVAQRMFMVECTNSAMTGVVLNSSTNNTKRQFSQYYGSTSSLSSNRTLNFSYNRFAFFLTPKRMGWGSTAYTQTKGNNTPTGGLIIGSNVAHTGQPYTGSIGIFRIYGSDAQNVSSDSGFNSYTPVYTLRPCTYNGEAGLWCVETNKFYGNTAGAGTLTASN